MQGGVIGGLCLLAFLLSLGRAEELEAVKNVEDSEDLEDLREMKETEDDSIESLISGAPDDLKSDVVSLAVTESNSQDNEEKSGAMAHSSSYSSGGLSMSKAVAQSYAGGSSSAYSDGFGASQSKTTAVAGRTPQASPLNPELSPYLSPRTGLSQVEAQAISEDGRSYDQGLDTYPYSASYPYSSDSKSAQAQAEADNGFYQPAPVSTPILSPYNQGLSSAQAQAQADDEFYQPQARPIPTPISNPYSPGASSAKAKARVDNEFYQPKSISTPIFSPYGQGSSFGQTNTQADSGLYQPGLIPSPIRSSPYNPGSSSAQAQAQGDSESYQSIIEPISILPKPITRFSQGSDSPSAFSSSYPYSLGSSPAKAQSQAKNELYQQEPKYRPYGPILDPRGQAMSSAQAQAQSDYQPVPIPDPSFSPYERFLVPYKGTSTNQDQTESEAYQAVPLVDPKGKPYEYIPKPYSPGSISASGFSSSPYGLKYSSAQAQAQSEREPYQPIPNPNFAPYDSFLLPYSGSTQAQAENEPHQPNSIPNPKQYESFPKPYSDRSDSASGFSSHPYSLRFNSAQTKAEEENEAYQAIPIPDQNPAPYESLMVPYRGPSSTQANFQAESESYQPIPIPHDTKSYSPLNYPVRSGTRPELDDVDLNQNQKSKNGWYSYAFNPYPPSSPNGQLYPTGADAEPYADVKPGAIDVFNAYSQGKNPYGKDYPSELLYQPGGFTQKENDGQGSLDPYASGQSSAFAFEDAKSRLILSHEYIFPNKMPGGDNAVQCTKENEFHHFWSQALDCLVCICVNEYGLLTPVCASCGGCHTPPPKPPPDTFPRLPEPVPVRPATPEPFEPYSPVPQPEPNPPEPIPDPYQPTPRPEPYPPPYPEPIPSSPTPETYTQLIPTLPPSPPGASCNPLPSGQPFTNPLHPCQICVCRESYNTGKPDVQIQCKENPQCIAPADVTALPPIPDVPVPIPLPMCEKFPEHVLFPHPTDGCKLCKCSKSLSESGIPEQQITCYPHPDCIPKLEPVTEPESIVPPPLPIPIDPYLVKPYPEPGPIPAEPLREPFQPMEPVPLPEIVTVEPLPWPPVTTIAPVSTPVPTLPVLTPRPGPLPGPSPHESCRPYPPNQPFQHPWDECQICLCTEAFAVGMITVEVNCYTKPACCVEPPDSVKPAITGNILFLGYTKPYPGISNAVNGPDSQVFLSGQQPSAPITSTYRPPSVYPSYSPRPVNIYPGNNQPSAADGLTQPQGYPGSYTRLQPDDAYANPPSSYPYQPNYIPGYGNQLYPEYSARPAQNAPYKPNNHAYPGNYQYGQGDPVGNTYPGPKGLYQPYDQRYQGAPAPNLYPSMYQRTNYDIPPMYPGQIRDSYGQSQSSAQGGPNAQSAALGYTGDRLRSKTGNDVQEDSDDSR